MPDSALQISSQLFGSLLETRDDVVPCDNDTGHPAQFEELKKKYEPNSSSGVLGAACVHDEFCCGTPNEPGTLIENSSWSVDPRRSTLLQSTGYNISSL